MRKLAILILVAFLPGVALSGCIFGGDESEGQREVTFTPPDDVPMPEGFVLKERDPIPFSEQVGSLRSVRAAWWSPDSPGMNQITVHFTSLLAEHGWELIGYDQLPAGTKEWRGRWRKGERQTLAVSYKEQIEVAEGKRQTTGEILIVMGGGR